MEQVRKFFRFEDEEPRLVPIVLSLCVLLGLLASFFAESNPYLFFGVCRYLLLGVRHATLFPRKVCESAYPLGQQLVAARSAPRLPAGRLLLLVGVGDVRFRPLKHLHGQFG